MRANWQALEGEDERGYQSQEVRGAEGPVGEREGGGSDASLRLTGQVADEELPSMAAYNAGTRSE
jgi:hypothetical protein